MRKLFVTILVSILLLSGCSTTTQTSQTTVRTFDGTTIQLSDTTILVNGEEISKDSSSAVYIGEDIVYYEEGHDETYGEGDASDAHSKEEAEKHNIIWNCNFLSSLPHFAATMYGVKRKEWETA